MIFSNDFLIQKFRLPEYLLLVPFVVSRDGNGRAMKNCGKYNLH